MSRRLPIAFILMVLIGSTAARADWINLSGAMSADNVAEFHVNDDHVRVVLEVYVHDLRTFMDLVPDKLLKSGIQRPSEDARVQRFASENLQIIADEQTLLSAQLILAEPRMRIDRPNPYAGMINPMTRRPVPGPPEDKRVLYAELVYPFAAGSRPQTLTLVPPAAEDDHPLVSIGFIAYHNNVPVLDYAYLSEPAQLTLDWQDPWYSRFKNKQFKRWQQSGVLTFLYVEPFEVRHETLVRVKDLAAWMDLGLRGDDYIEADEFSPLKKHIGEFLLTHSQVTIDGQTLTPVLDRINFVKRTMTRTYFINQPERMPLNTAMVGVVVTYLTNAIPQRVTVDWDLFSDRVQRVPTVAQDPVGPFPSYVTPDDPVLVWQNYLKKYQPPTVARIVVDKGISHMKIPAASMLCLALLVPAGLQIRSRRKRGQPIRFYVGSAAVLMVLGTVLVPFGRIAVGRPAMLAPQIENEQAVAIVESLLKNIYRSFDFREESAIYDRLATSVSGDLLETIYLQNRKSMVVTQAGGAQAKVKTVEIQEVTVAPMAGNPIGLVFHTRWTAMGTVGHWGHIHSRENWYDANISVEPIDGAWKITGLELLEEKRIDPYGSQNKSAGIQVQNEK